MTQTPSLKDDGLLRREGWNRTIRDRANQANKSPCQPNYRPTEYMRNIKASS